ncbi:MAG: DUF3795 domain-containing protein [Promethearchaeota archaeon]|jgi:hypothetical protein
MKTEEWDISVCGLNCAKCNLYHTNECGKCRGPVEAHWSPDCIFLPCAREKGHQYCFECDEFPCQNLEDFAFDGYDHHKQTVENMKRMREIGIEEWIAEQKTCMFCPG